VRAPLLRAFGFAAIVVLACCVFGLLAPARAAGIDTIEIVSGNGVHPFSVELATNEAERSVGLMYRKSMPEGHGMLFDFGFPQPVAFWMHNTYISLDMFFISTDGHIIRIAENAKPMTDTLIPSGGMVRGVLEVIAGTARKLGIKAGDRVTGSIFGKGT
jgi:uncharacterized membrane protein (UPF0127 family)